ncbi:MAG TPA: oxalyl-CoA decarboxylase [Thermoanaerobaculia bacterium]|nr:oxalyl-CoA decarboxylase [Thermoanaerobaculia bacterium]
MTDQRDRSLEARGGAVRPETSAAPPERAPVPAGTAAAAEIRGGTVIARALKAQGVEYMFGIVGYPVYGVAAAAQKEGIQYFGFRNEQAASYAAGAVGYLTGRPGACLTVSGPGMIHGLAGLANAQSNCWPMLLLSGSSETYLEGKGAFQECPQVDAARIFAKYSARPDSLRRVPIFVEQAVRASLYGRPGAVYLDLPSDQIDGRMDPAQLELPPRCPDPPRPLADPRSIERALALLRAAERPLVVVGKGAAWSRAEAEVRALVERACLPFLPTPMGKGVIPDDHPLCTAAARSFALANADVVFLIGARLNWILHFGQPPRFAGDARLIQLDIAAEEIGTNVPVEVPLVGDARSVLTQVLEAFDVDPFTHAADSPWRQALAGSGAKNTAAVEAMMRSDVEPMGYYRALREIRDRLPGNAFLVCEGANTMDISRTVLPNQEPRTRLDAGTFGTMGVGCGFAIAAAAVHPERKVVCIQGDSAFGFSGMEVEVACRHALPITWVVINNGGIGSGVTELDRRRIPTTAYLPDARYEKVMEAFGGRGFYAASAAELGPALDQALSADVPALVNVRIDPKATRKPQPFAWLTR